MRYLLLVDASGNVVLADVDKDVRMPIGAPLPPSSRSHVTTAVWSHPGQWTAWSVSSNEIDGIREVRLHDEDSDLAGVLVESASSFYLCPSPCGRWLSHLASGPLGLELAVSNVSTGELTIIERGQPMFWSWSADSTQLAVHVEHRVLVTDHEGQSRQVLTEMAGPFVTPQWLPGGSVLYAIDDRIVAGGPDTSVSTLVGGGSTGRFALDPEGRRLTYVDVAGDNASVVVLDLVSLEPTEITTEPVLAFFWAPDGRQLAVLIAAEGGRVQWLVTDGSDTCRLEPFSPTRAWAGSVVPFFEQYTQSHAVWSHDSSDLVAPAVDEHSRSGALVQAADSSGQTTWLRDAELAWWA